MARLTRLEKLLFRLEAQYLCLAWAFKEVSERPGVVFELGLGHGRTYDHMRERLPGRDIYVFDRELDCFDDCVPPDDRLFLGDIGDTLTAAAQRFRRKVVLAHCDMGAYSTQHNEAMSDLLSQQLPAVLAPAAIVLSDLPLDMPGARALPLPAGARDGRYFVYRAGPGFHG